MGDAGVVGQQVKPIKAERIALDGGTAAFTRNGENYVPACHMTILTPQETYYNLWIMPKGMAGTLAGEMSHDNWNQRDTLLWLNKEEDVDGKNMKKPIAPEEAKDIKTIFKDIKEGRQVVYEELIGEKLEKKEFIDKVVSFLEPRIEVAAENVDDKGLVELRVVDNELGEKRDIPGPLRL
jgi:hypothetical protein